MENLPLIFQSASPQIVEINQPLPRNPKLGDRWVNVYPWPEVGKWTVDVKVFKANTLRGDAYWVTEAHKSYSKKADAERFAARFN